MKTDPFLNAIMSAESSRLPPSWKCEPISAWKLERENSGEVSASAITYCMGPEQHLNIDFKGGLEKDKSGMWRVRLNLFRERPGE